MFKYGKRGGYMGIALVVLSLLPLVVAAFFIPGLADQVPMKVASDGEVLRMGSRLELLTLPVVCALVGLATLGSAFKQASNHEDLPSMAKMMFERFCRNGLITAAVLNLLNVYLFYMVVTGHGMGF